MFDGVCILASLFLYSKAQEQYKSIAFYVLCFFVISETVYQRFFLDIREANQWLIYLIYSAINISLIYKLAKAKAHLVIILILCANVLLNIPISLYFVSDIIPESVYDNYFYPAALFMILSLIYMWMLGNGTRYLDQCVNHKTLGSFLFWDSYRNPFRNIL